MVILAYVVLAGGKNKVSSGMFRLPQVIYGFSLAVRLCLTYRRLGFRPDRRGLA
jgi:hypothetical protein